MTLMVDGFIRVSVKEFMETRFVHHMSWEDDELRDELQGLGVNATAAGYCEWKSHAAPGISIGWTWFRLAGRRRPLLGPEGLRSNLMLRCANGYDMGSNISHNLMISWLSCLAWERQCP
ncbi:DUF4902 domain-containing protein [Pseudomonas sp. QD4]